MIKYIIYFMAISVMTLGGSKVLSVAQHVDDPTKCTKVCVPEGYDGELPDSFPEDVIINVCQSDICAKAGHGDENCKSNYSCSVYCSEVCCVCLRECI